jgi:hypothetical protein
MKLRKQQQGITVFGLAFILMLIGIVTFTALKLIPPYMQNFYVRGALDSVVEDQAAEFSGSSAVRSALLKRLNINNVTNATHEDLIVIRDGDVYSIDVDYEVEIPYAYNIFLILRFTNHAEVPVR